MANQVSSSHVRVVLRVRPFLPSEVNPISDQKISQIPCISILDQQQTGGEVAVLLKDQFSRYYLIRTISEIGDLF